ncbi:hypothetical protein BD413DRAFT_500536 [Trametes elegans]|nr:hypothetical protein BD413DRAFT_500536 [Trametes elegans]
MTVARTTLCLTLVCLNSRPCLIAPKRAPRSDGAANKYGPHPLTVWLASEAGGWFVAVSSSCFLRMYTCRLHCANSGRPMSNSKSPYTPVYGSVRQCTPVLRERQSRSITTRTSRMPVCHTFQSLQ